jgi:hypothetical protein
VRKVGKIGKITRGILAVSVGLAVALKSYAGALRQRLNSRLRMALSFLAYFV